MNKGFTILEVLLSIATITIIAGIIIPVYESFQVRNELDLAAGTIAAGIWQAPFFILAHAAAKALF